MVFPNVKTQTSGCKIIFLKLYIRTNLWLVSLFFPFYSFERLGKIRRKERSCTHWLSAWHWVTARETEWPGCFLCLRGSWAEEPDIPGILVRPWALDQSLVWTKGPAEAGVKEGFPEEVTADLALEIRGLPAEKGQASRAPGSTGQGAWTEFSKARVK